MEDVSDGENRGVTLATLPEDPYPTYEKIAKVLILFGDENGDQHMLLMRDLGGRYKGMLNPPGGHIEGNESPWEAASRELQEETGLVIPGDELELLGVTTLHKQRVVGYLLVHRLMTMDDVRHLSNPEDQEHQLWLFRPSTAISPEYRDMLVPGIRESLERLFTRDRLVPWAGKLILRHTIGEPDEPKK